MAGLARWLLRLVIGSVLLLATAALALWLFLRAPALQIPEPGLVLQDVTLVNPGSERLAHRRITLVGERIQEIGPASAASRDPGPEDPFLGRYVLPGLVDLHVHHPPFFLPGERELFALLFLAHGVTSVRDVGDTIGSVLPHARNIAAGSVAGPRIFACGPFLDGDPPEWPTARVIPNRSAAREAVAELAAEGVSCLKIYNAVSAAVYDMLLEEAAKRDLPVVVHVPYRVPFDRLGAVEVQHMMGLTWDWDTVKKGELEAYVATSKAQGISHTPTFVTFRRAAQLADYPALAVDPIARIVPPYYREILWNPELNPLVLDLSPAVDDTIEGRLGQMKQTAALLHAAGVPVLAGTDTINPFVIPGAGLHEELRHLAEAGLGPEEAWAAASRRAGEALRVADLGVLRRGAPADLLIFREDPSRDLDALDTLEAVVAAGRLYPRAALDRELERQRSHFAHPLRRKLAEGAAHEVLRRYRDLF